MGPAEPEQRNAYCQRVAVVLGKRFSKNQRLKGTADLVLQLEQLAGCPSVPPDYLRLRVDVLRAQRSALEQLEAGPAEPGPRYGGTVPPGRENEWIVVPRPVGLRLLDQIAAACGRCIAGSAPLERLAEAIHANPRLLESLVRHAMEPIAVDLPGGIVQSLGVPAELARLVGRLLAAPFVVHGVPKRLKAATVAPLGGMCPACGAEPGLATLWPDGGQRGLHCSVCGWSWPFERLGCPYCSEQGPGTLWRMGDENDPGRWVESCQRCGRYLRVADLRVLVEPGRFVPLVEHVQGLYLDVLARNHGCLPAPPYAALW